MLEFIFGLRNPTRSWRPSGDLPLVFDLAAASLNRVGLGQRLECLAFLGTDEGATSYRSGELLYFSRGLGVRFSPTSQCVVEYRIVVNDPLETRFRPFAGSVFAGGGRQLDVTTLSAARWVEQFGECFWHDRDADKSIMFYESVGLEWQIEFDAKSRVNCIIVTNEPVMADQEQRIAYNVTKAWPPRTWWNPGNGGVV